MALGKGRAVSSTRVAALAPPLGQTSTPCAGRHGRHHPAGLGARLVDKRRGVAQAQHVKPARVAPRLLDLAAQHLAGRAPERTGVEGSEIEHVAAH
jgi:hypothetical protein